MTSAEWFAATIIAFLVGGVIYFLVRWTNKRKRRGSTGRSFFDDNTIWLLILLLPLLWVLEKVRKR